MVKPFPDIAQILDMTETILDQSETPESTLGKIAALLEEQISHYHWVGFYLVDDSKANLVLGPFVGNPTDHTKIAFGKGVCGQVAVSEMSRIIQDVTLEDNYLSCGTSVRSEIVFPIMKDGTFVAELDIDSQTLSPFTDLDSELLEAICLKLERLF